MKALSLTQPWATLVAISAKKIETRSWATSYRGPIAIHAAKAFPGSAKDLCYMTPFKEALGMPEGTHLFHRDPTPPWWFEAKRLLNALPRGAILATGQLVAVLPTESLDKLDRRERIFGDYSADRYAWFLEDVKPLSEPIPAKGALGLWEFEGL